MVSIVLPMQLWQQEHPHSHLFEIRLTMTRMTRRTSRRRRIEDWGWCSWIFDSWLLVCALAYFVSFVDEDCNARL